MARTTGKFTKETCDAIVKNVRKGMYYKDACAIVGIAKRTGTEWLERGRGTHKRKQTAQLKAFVEAIDKARAEFKLQAIGEIKEAGQPHDVVKVRTITKPDGVVEKTVEITRKRSWTAWAWLLERLFPDEFSRKTRRTDDDDDQDGPTIIRLPAGGPSD